MAVSESEDLLHRIQRIEDRQEIEDLTYLYARGIDRHDLQLMVSCFHEDAIEEHGTYFGLVQDWTKDDMVLDAFKKFDTMLHIVTNQLIEFEDDNTAHGESIVHAIMTRNDEGRPMIDVVAGRYLNRFERRAGVWKIARRTFLADFGEARQITPDYPPDRDKYEPGGLAPDDLVYHWNFRDKAREEVAGM